MPNWEVINKARLRRGAYASDDTFGLNGAFGFRMAGEARLICVIASDQEGWKHVSVSFGQASPKTPSWEVMCFIKDIFFEPEETVMQLHPPKSHYVNHHPGCLHLWAPRFEKIPLPPKIFV